MAKIVSDVIVDLQYGDSGKGKVAYHLCQTGNYDLVIRYNGGANAGHTVYHKGKKLVTHAVPVGVLFGIPSVIGPGCVINPEALFLELKKLEEAGINTKGKVLVASNTHVTTKAHLKEDGVETKVGTTKRGIGPTYRDKHARTGIRAEDVVELKDYLVDIHELIHDGKDKTILGEGAQGFGLDIDWGDYPYVTSSHATVAGAIQSGIPQNSIRDVWGVVKAYETYVGGQKWGKPFQPKGDVFLKIQKAGNEFGATTGRPRETNWLDTNLVTRGAQHNSVTKLVVNKVDILAEVGVWGMIYDGKAKEYQTEDEFLEAMLKMAKMFDVDEENVFFSRDPEKI